MFETITWCNAKEQSVCHLNLAARVVDTRVHFFLLVSMSPLSKLYKNLSLAILARFERAEWGV